MKKTLSLILAALLLASSLAACGKTEPKETEKNENNAVETKAPETDAPETSTPETEAPTPAYATDRITENGAATAHIVVAEGADSLLGYAAEELVNHIKLVSGADVTVTNEAQSDSLPIIIATPDTNPELETLFADDLAWLRDLGNPAEDVRFGDDGFAIRAHEGKLYIFGVTPRGALNGVYDFIEENMGVLWTRADEDLGTVYEEQATVTVTKTDYREKSPFQIRSWTLAGHSLKTETMLSRNKLNYFAGHPGEIGSAKSYATVGMMPFVTNHNIVWWITNSPSYDPNNHEYWSTDRDGVHVSSSRETSQVNFWSDMTVQCVADSIVAFLDTHTKDVEIDYIGICLQDFQEASVYPEMSEPYEYAPGQFVDPTDEKFLSTVFYSFLNKVSVIVKEKYPEVTLHTYAYGLAIEPPACDIGDLYITLAPIHQDLNAPLGEERKIDGQKEYAQFLEWLEVTPNMQMYNYYGCYTTSPLYERPIWSRIQSDLQLYAANGFNGNVPEGEGDDDVTAWQNEAVYKGERIPYYTHENSWAMNAMTYWIYSKLVWNPNENVDELVEYYCDKVYGEASELMQEYYRLLQLGWKHGYETMLLDGRYYDYRFQPVKVWDYFLLVEVDGVWIIDEIIEVLHQAYDTADEKEKERLSYIVEVYDNIETLLLE